MSIEGATGDARRPDKVQRSQAPYPGRTGRGIFAMKLQRLIWMSALASDLGLGPVCLLLRIADAEDRFRYAKAPTFWDSQLEEQLGVNQKTLASYRMKCVNAGWLHYEPGGRNREGRYFITVPEWAVAQLDVSESSQFALANPDDQGSADSPNEPKQADSTENLRLNGVANGTKQEQVKNTNGTNQGHSIPTAITSCPSNPCLKTMDGGWGLKIEEKTLKQPKAIESLFLHACKKNWLQRDDRLRFFTACVSVQRRSQLPASDPSRVQHVGKCLTQITKNKRWDIASNLDEDAARRMISLLDHGPRPTRDGQSVDPIQIGSVMRESTLLGRA